MLTVKEIIRKTDTEIFGRRIAELLNTEDEYD